MPRCACTSEVYGSVCVCVCVCQEAVLNINVLVMALTYCTYFLWPYFIFEDFFYRMYTNMWVGMISITTFCII